MSNGAPLILGLALVGSQPAAPVPMDAQAFCAAIERIAAAARERPTFHSIRRALAAGEVVVPDFETGRCEVTAAGVECRREQSSPYDFEHLPDLSACRGVVAVESPPQLNWRYGPRSARTYRVGGFLIDHGVRCPGCRALGPTYFNMTFDPPPLAASSRP